LQGLVDFNGLDNVGGNSLKVNLANAAFWGRNIHTVDSGVGEAWLGAADLHVSAFASSRSEL